MIRTAIHVVAWVMASFVGATGWCNEPVVDVLELDFFPIAIMHSSNGRFAIVRGTDVAEPPMDSYGGLQPGTAEHLAVLDLTQSKVIASKKLSEGFGVMLVDDDSVYLSAGKGDAIYSMDHRLERQQVVFSGQETNQFFPFGNDLLVPGNRTATYIDRKSMKVSKIENGTRISMDQRVNRNSQYGALVLKRHLYDLSSGEILRMGVYPGTLPLLIPGRKDEFSRRAKFARYAYTDKELLERGGMVRYKGDEIKEATPKGVYNTVTCLFNPFTYWYRLVADRTTKNVAFELGLISPQADEMKVETYRIEDIPSLTHKAYRRFTPRAVDCPGFLLIPVDKFIYLVNVQACVADVTPPPAHFALKQPQQIPFGGLVESQIALGGDDSMITLAMKTEIPHVSVTPTGTLEIDTDQLWQQLIDQMTDTHSKRSDQAGVIEELFQLNADAYSELTGEPIQDGEYAASVPINVELRDEQGTGDVSYFELMLLGPSQPLEASLRSVEKSP